MASSGLDDSGPRKRLEAAIAILEGSPGSLDKAAAALASLLVFVEGISVRAMESLLRMGEEAA